MTNRWSTAQGKVISFRLSDGQYAQLKRLAARSRDHKTPSQLVKWQLCDFMDFCDSRSKAQEQGGR